MVINIEDEFILIAIVFFFRYDIIIIIDDLDSCTTDIMIMYDKFIS